MGGQEDVGAGWFALRASAGSTIIFLGMALLTLAALAVVLVPLTWFVTRRRRTNRN